MSDHLGVEVNTLICANISESTFQNILKIRKINAMNGYFDHADDLRDVLSDAGEGCWRHHIQRGHVLPEGRLKLACKFLKHKGKN